MPHNFVLFKRGTMEQYEPELFGSMNEPNAQLRGFVPDSPNVIVASRLLNAGESMVLTFDALGAAQAYVGRNQPGAVRIVRVTGRWGAGGG